MGIKKIARNQAIPFRGRLSKRANPKASPVWKGTTPKANRALLSKARIKLGSLKILRYCSNQIHSKGKGEPSLRVEKERTTARAKGRATNRNNPTKAGATRAIAADWGVEKKFLFIVNIWYVWKLATLVVRGKTTQATLVAVKQLEPIGIAVFIMDDAEIFISNSLD